MENMVDGQSTTQIITRYARLLWHWAWLIVLSTALVAGMAFFLSNRQKPVYQASAMVMINISTSSQDLTTSAYLASTFAASYSDIMTSRTVMEAVAQRLGLNEDLSGSVTVTHVTNSQLLIITATDNDPKRAALIANTVVSVFNEQDNADKVARFEESKLSLKSQMDALNQQIQTTSAKLAVLGQEIQENNTTLSILQTPDDVKRTQAELNQRASQIREIQSTLQSKVGEQAQLQILLQNDQNSYATLERSYESIRLAEAVSTSGVLLKDAAIPPEAPSQPRPIRSALLGGFVGFFLSVGTIFLIEYLDDTFKTPEDVNRVLQLPVVGMISAMEHLKDGSGKVYVGEYPRSPIAEAFRLLRANLEFASVDKPLHTLLVTSVGPEEGKTTSAVNLAVIFAQGGKRVLLVDSDLRRPNVHKQLNIQNWAGLSDLFLGNTNGVLKSCSWGDIKISVIPSGPLPPNPSELLGSEKFEKILNKLAENVDIVILDSPPSIVSDPIIISSKVDGVLLVIKPGTTKMGAAQELLEQFQRSGARVVGVLLNPLPRNFNRFNSKYDYYSKN